MGGSEVVVGRFGGRGWLGNLGRAWSGSVSFHFYLFELPSMTIVSNDALR